MSFTDQSKLPASDKFYMVRVEGATLITQDTVEFVETVNIGGIDYHTYQCKLPKRLYTTTLYANTADELPDVEFTKQKDFEVIEGNAYWYDPDTGDFKISTTYDPSNDSLVLSFFLFFTQFTGKRGKLNFEDGNDDVYWHPRLPKDFSLNINQQSSITGQFSSSSGSVQLKNNDLYFNDFTSPYFTFANREVKVWRCINTVDDFQFEYSGVIKSLGLDDSTFTIGLSDRFTVLDKTAYGGNESRKYYSDMNDGVNYKVRADDQDRPVYRLLGKISPYDVLYYNTTQDLQVRFLNPDTDKMLPATCVSYNPASKATNTNRTWSCGFGPSNATVITKAVTTHNHYVTSGTYDASRFVMSTANNSDKLCVGDTFRLGAQTGFIMGVAGNIVESWPYNAGFAAGNLERAKVTSVIIIVDEIKYYARSFRDYDCQIGTKGDLQIVFKNNFEANHAGMGTLDPDTCQIFARWYNDDYDSQASSIVEEMLTAAGIPTGSTFNPFKPDQTKPWPDPYCIITLPFLGESQFPSIREVVQRCLVSGLGMLYFDSYGGILYKSLLDDHYYAPLYEYRPENIINVSGSDPDDELNQGNSEGFSASFDLYDHYAGTYFEMDNTPQNGNNFYAPFPEAYKTIDAKFNRVKRFYKSDLFYTVKNCVIDTERLELLDTVAVGLLGYFDLYNKLITGRRVEVKLTSFSRHFNLYIGDNIKVERRKIIGNSSDYFRVVGISKDVNETELTLTDNKRFPR